MKGFWTRPRYSLIEFGIMFVVSSIVAGFVRAML